MPTYINAKKEATEQRYENYIKLIYETSFVITRNNFNHVQTLSKTWIASFFNIVELQMHGLDYNQKHKIALFILIRRRGVDFKIFQGNEINQIKTTTDGKIKLIGGKTIRINYKNASYSVLNLAVKVAENFRAINSYEDLIKLIVK